jgi:hypothetical protein
MMAGSILIDSLVVVEALQAPALRVLDRVVWSTSRWPMSLDANSEVPPCSLAEQRKMTVLPAIFDDRVSRCFVSTRNLGDGLKSKDATPAKFAHACQSVFQAVNLAEGVELVDDEP